MSNCEITFVRLFHCFYIDHSNQFRFLHVHPTRASEMFAQGACLIDESRLYFVMRLYFMMISLQICMGKCFVLVLVLFLIIPLSLVFHVSRCSSTLCFDCFQRCWKKTADMRQEPAFFQRVI